MTRFLASTLLLLASMLPSAQADEQKVGDFTIYYQAFGSTFLTPAIAKAYGIQRSSYIGIVNIAVKRGEGVNAPAVPVEITGVAKNLLDSNIQLKFKQITEGDAIYYIAQVPYRHSETLHFQIGIKHERSLNTTVKFKQAFYTD